MFLKTLASTGKRIIISGSLPCYQRGSVHFRRHFALNKYLKKLCNDRNVFFCGSNQHPHGVTVLFPETSQTVLETDRQGLVVLQFCLSE